MGQPENPEQKNPGPHPPPRWKAVLGWSLLAAAVVGLLWAILKAARRGAAGQVVAAALPVAGAVAALAHTPSARRPRIDREALARELVAAAAVTPLWTPTQLAERLRERGFPLSSPQHLARDLSDLGLSSQVLTVPGQTARRWYDLTPLKQA